MSRSEQALCTVPTKSLLVLAVGVEQLEHVELPTWLQELRAQPQQRAETLVQAPACAGQTAISQQVVHVMHYAQYYADDACHSAGSSSNTTNRIRNAVRAFWLECPLPATVAFSWLLGCASLTTGRGAVHFCGSFKYLDACNIHCFVQVTNLKCACRPTRLGSAWKQQ